MHPNPNDRARDLSWDVIFGGVSPQKRAVLEEMRDEFVAMPEPVCRVTMEAIATKEKDPMWGAVRNLVVDPGIAKETLLKLFIVVFKASRHQAKAN
jgi:hypothetical protein